MKKLWRWLDENPGPLSTASTIFFSAVGFLAWLYCGWSWLLDDDHSLFSLVVSIIAAVVGFLAWIACGVVR